jgi:hypothetical protein
MILELTRLNLINLVFEISIVLEIIGKFKKIA